MSTRSGADLGAELAEPALGRLDDAIGVLVGRRGGQHEHLVGAAQLEELAVEVAAGAPLGAADEGEGPGHGGTLPGGVLAPGCYPSVASPPMAIATLGIVGSGIMGSGIAEVAAKAGVDVILRSRQQASADAMVASLEKSLAKQVERGKLDETAAKEIGARVTATDDLHALHDCDLVLESVVEDLAVKKELFTRLDDIVKPEGILATNTSTLPVVELAVATERPVAGGGHPLLQPGADDEPRRGRRGR